MYLLLRQRPGDLTRKLTVKKIYAVGLEMLCPAGALDWAPEIPSPINLAGSLPRKYELVHISAPFCWKYAASTQDFSVRLSLCAEDDGLRRIALAGLGVAAGAVIPQSSWCFRDIAGLHDAGRAHHDLVGRAHGRLCHSSIHRGADDTELRRR